MAQLPTIGFVFEVQQHDGEEEEEDEGNETPENNVQLWKQKQDSTGFSKFEKAEPTTHTNHPHYHHHQPPSPTTLTNHAHQPPSPTTLTLRDVSVYLVQIHLPH